MGKQTAWMGMWILPVVQESRLLAGMGTGVGLWASARARRGRYARSRESFPGRAAHHEGQDGQPAREGLKTRSRKRFLTLFLAIGGDGYPLSGSGKSGVIGLSSGILGLLRAGNG